MFSTWGAPSAEDRFKAMHSEIIMYFQCIEHDMKRIYSGMSADDYYDCMDSLDGNNWGVILNKLKKLDRSDNDPYFTEEEYQQICNSLKLYDLPLYVEGLSPEDILAATRKDKKMEQGQIKFILMDGLGKSFIDKTVTDQELLVGIRAICR